ncbi:MAG: hypothetical protein IKP36_06955 [Bacteroidaceae bacterium]|nr:hypothetical protein [Bacteroidaceae bacterium]
MKKLLTLLAFLGIAAMASAQVTFTALDGTEWGWESQNLHKLFDNTYKNWGSGASGAWFTFQASESVILTGYAIRTGSDGESTNLARNPKSWTIYGSNNDSNHGKDGDWTPIGNVDNDASMDGKIQKTFYFSLTNNTPYKYYKVTIDANQGPESNVQISEFIPSYSIPEAASHNCNDNYHTYSMNGNINQQVDICDVCHKVVYSGQHRNIKLKDGEPFAVVGGGWGEGYGNFTYSRASGKMGTICLPYHFLNVGERTEARYYTLTSYDSGADALVFERVTEKLSANTPAIYILNDNSATSIDLSCNNAGFSPTPADSALTTNYDGWLMVGTVKSGKTDESYLTKSIYYLKNNLFKRCNQYITYKPFRAFIAGTISGSDVKAINIADNMEDTINSLTETENGEIQLYDLSGRKVNDIRNGEIYIMNGRKVMFNK